MSFPALKGDAELHLAVLEIVDVVPPLGVHGIE
jgi:hypothetical protein